MKYYIALLIALIFGATMFGAVPEIKWWFDTKDASAGQ